MAVVLRCGSELLHIPKTGGSWVTSVLEANDLISQHRGHKHADFDRNLLSSAFSARQHLSEVLRLTKEKFLYASKNAPISEAPFRFCFVRHPLSWYESWWKYMKGRNWNDWGTQNSADNWHPNSILNGLGSDDFNEFVWNIVRVRPGYVSELYASYTKPGIGFIGKTETLRDDLCYVLDLLGHSYSKDSILSAKRENVSKTKPSEIRWDPDLRLLVMRLELSALVNFDYLTESERNILGVEHALPPHKSLKRNDL